jgi:hypothetical protein
MAQYRQSGAERFLGPRGLDLHHSSNGAPDHVALGIRGAPHKPARARRSARSDKSRRVSVGAVIVILSLVLVVTVLAYYYLARDTKGQFLSLIEKTTAYLLAFLCSVTVEISELCVLYVIFPEMNLSYSSNAF